MPVPQTVLDLVARFEANHDSYTSVQYNETQLRREFLDPFFKALGWDIANEQGLAEAYKDVIHEDAIRIGSDMKAPDYCFRIGGMRKFFVEAKKPAVNLQEAVGPAFQLRRYGWSAKLPLSILTDFEEFAIYDCRVKPKHGDRPSVALQKYYNYKQYAESWDEIAAIFSKEGILKGSFDKYAEGQGKRGSTTVDDAFLEDIDEWRRELASNLALRNHRLSQQNLNYAVQSILDRIIFLRICEDRGLEDYGRLQALVNGENTYKRLGEMFLHADDRYNSGLFHFKQERGRTSAPDELTLDLKIDDDLIKKIIRHLYYPESPYAFSVISADILGQVYEQFLGKVIRLTPEHHAKVEEKPEVKKAGGVYYTPKYIVDYIVENTVGKLLEGKTAKHAAELRILDPACGSGSFLIGAYQKLLDWHLEFYIKDGAEKWLKGKRQTIYHDQRGRWRLTTAERKRILTSNIYGVDIDPQAVEVTKLSLLLKVLEGETSQTLNSQMRLFHERALPDLTSNIKCGNSLIGTDFYQSQLKLGEEDEYRVNVFNWQTEFAKIMSAGGFDAVIGNPPYIQLSMADYYNESIKTYLLQNYSSSMGRLNTFGLFIERVLKLMLSNKGLLSFIVPNTLLTQEYYQSLRKELLKYRIVNLTTFQYPVFTNAVVETIVIVVQKTFSKDNIVDIVDYDNKTTTFRKHNIAQILYSSTFKNAFSVKIDRASIGLRTKLDKTGPPLQNIANINQAIALKHDRSQSLFKESKGEKYKPVLDGRNIQRYTLEWGGYYLAYDVNKIHSCKRNDIFEAKEKILFRRVGDRLIATYDDNQFYALNTLVIITLDEKIEISIKYVLGLLNSALLNYYYKTYLKSNKKVFSEIQARQISQLPVCSINFNKSVDKARHDRVVLLVERILELHKKMPAVKTDHEKTRIKRQIEATDKEIDGLVYKLYDLTEAEIKTIEEST